MKPFDWFLEGFGAAVRDVRQKVVEEPWYGKSLGCDHHPLSMAEALGWAKEKSSTHDIEPTHGLPPKAPDGIGYER